MASQGERYDGVTVSLHWITALLVGVLWVIGQTADSFPKGTFQSAYWSTHVVLGFVLVLVFLSRVGWRVSAGRRLPRVDPLPLHVLAKANHYALYLAIVIVLSLGVANAYVRGYDIYGLFHLPQLGNKDLRRPITLWHGRAANVVLILAGLHALAALGHHYILRDGVLRRMTPSRTSGVIARPRRN